MPIASVAGDLNFKLCRKKSAYLRRRISAIPNRNGRTSSRVGSSVSDCDIKLQEKPRCRFANLKPCKLCGVDSYGMILASGEEDVKVIFLDKSVKNGDRVR